MAIKGKTCSVCYKDLPLDNFPKRSLVCKPCTNAKAKARYWQDVEKSRAKNREAGRKCYAKNSDKYLERSRDYYNNNKHLWQERYRYKFHSPKRETARLYVYNYLKEHPCVTCGESDPVVLEFDHLDPTTKVSTVSHLMLKGSLDELITEIKKCQVLCANCHKRKTARDRNWIILTLQEKEV